MKQKLFFIILFIFILTTGILLHLQLTQKKASLGPVILIGLDGADWNIMNPLIEEGKLPYLNKLIQEGSSGVLETVKPTKSPVVWTSIATGKSMLKHGILDWSFVEKNKIKIPYSASERRVKAFWNILSERKRSVGVINWFCTYPPEEVNGFLISDRFRDCVFEFPLNEVVTFPSKFKMKLYPLVVRTKDRKYQKTIRKEEIPDYLRRIKSMNADIPESRKAQLSRGQIYFLQDKSIENISLYLQATFPVDLFVTYFRFIDTTSHFGSLFISDDLREKWVEENQKFGKPTLETEKLLYQEMTSFIEPVYSYLDNVVGRIMEKADENTTFVVVSDHGFNFSEKGYNHYDTPEIPHGIVIMKGPAIKKKHRLEKANIYDITPTLLHLFDLPVGKDMDGTVLIESFNETHKKRNKVRFIPSYDGLKQKTGQKRSKDLDKKALEELKNLGYIK